MNENQQKSNKSELCYAGKFSLKIEVSNNALKKKWIEMHLYLYCISKQ